VSAGTSRRRVGLAGALVLVAALAIGLLAAVAVDRLVRGSEGPRVALDFRDARGLVPDADVLVAGARAGRVERIALTDAGTARVTVRLHDDVPAPRRDATAAIRPADLLGDVVLDLSPGRDRAPLTGPLPVARTVNAPRFEELLETFDGPTRDGLQALLAEAGRALTGRGADLSAALVALRPALRAGDRVLRELDDQDDALGRVVASAERSVGALAATSGDGERTIDALDARLRTVARAADDGRLAAGLTRLPGTVARLRGAADALTTSAGRLRPVAADLAALAPGLAESARRIRPFLATTRRATRDLRPALRQVGTLLAEGGPTLAALTSGLRAGEAIAPDLARFLAVAEEAAPATARGFFVNFADQGAEGGRQPLDPSADPARNYWRGAAVFSCEAFGVPIRPNCLADAFAPRNRAGGRK
jgi:phospholipid/cholesterol/gamma-HCH transport system substrate-binding protein